MATTRSKTRIAVVSNCQGRPLADLLTLVAPTIEIVGIIITHLTNPEEEEAATKILEQADYIFAQAVQDTYPTGFVRSNNLRRLFGEKVIVWPNIFFKGQTPELGYITRPGAGRVIGPLGEYQHLPIYEAWREQLSVAETVNRLNSDGSWLDKLSSEPGKSLEELVERESGCEVKISTEISEKWQTERLFFTFNHPSRILLERVARALLAYIGQPVSQTSPPSREPLDRIIPGLLPAIANRLCLRLETSTVTKGCRVEFDREVKFTKDVVYYDLHELVAVSFSSLDKQITLDSSVRIT